MLLFAEFIFLKISLFEARPKSMPAKLNKAVAIGVKNSKYYLTIDCSAERIVAAYGGAVSGVYLNMRNAAEYRAELLKKRTQMLIRALLAMSKSR